MFYHIIPPCLAIKMHTLEGVSDPGLRGGIRCKLLCNLFGVLLRSIDFMFESHHFQIKNTPWGCVGYRASRGDSLQIAPQFVWCAAAQH